MVMAFGKKLFLSLFVLALVSFELRTTQPRRGVTSDARVPPTARPLVPPTVQTQGRTAPLPAARPRLPDRSVVAPPASR
ncbi:unnamed protein product [Merluccius merluccius]